MPPITKSEINQVYYICNSKTSSILTTRTLKVFGNYIFVAAREIDFNNSQSFITLNLNSTTSKNIQLIKFFSKIVLPSLPLFETNCCLV